MAKAAVVEERVEIRERVEVRLPRKDVEHIVRCWIDHTMGGVPKPKDFKEIEVRFHTYDCGEGDGLLAAVVTYTPQPRDPQ